MFRLQAFDANPFFQVNVRASVVADQVPREVDSYAKRSPRISSQQTTTAPHDR
jgi:hypothetical protein